jgi:YHS domain-containing protein/(2Fe-2S) ferredoxin
MSGDLGGDPSEGLAAPPRLTVCSLCAGERLGTTDQLPGGQMSRLTRLEAAGVTRLTLVECLDECERGDVVVVRPASHHRAAGATPVWFERLAGDDLTDELARWLMLGGPGAAPVPLALRELVIRSGEHPPSENGLHDGHSMDPRDPEESMTTSSTTMTDPVCLMTVDPDMAAAITELDGETYYFCSKGCLRTFLADPTQYVTP